MRNKFPDISIITPVYNTRACFLDKYFESVITQKGIAVELILVDDGSKLEETREWFAAIEAKELNNVKVIHQEKNRGIAKCRNIALDCANGKYIAILDSDDYYDNDYLRTMYDIAEKENVDLVASGYTWVSENEQLIKIFKLPNKRNKYALLAVPCSARIFKRSILEKKKIRYPEGYQLEDTVFNIAVINAASSFAFADIAGFFNREHENRFSHGRAARFAVQYDKIPFQYAKNIMRELNQNKMRHNEEISGEMINVMASIACIFNAENDNTEKKEIIKESADFIRCYIPNYIINSLKYMIFSYSSSAIRLIQFGYALCVKLRIEGIYADLIISILKRAC